MTDEIQVTNAEIFSRYAEIFVVNIIWKKLISWPVRHEKLGAGKIVKVEDRPNGTLLSVDFEDDDIKKFYASDFAKRFSMEEFPCEIPNMEILRSVILQEKVKIREAELRQIEEERRLEERRKKGILTKKERQIIEEKQKKAEHEARQEFVNLKKKYQIDSSDNDPISPLFTILKKFNGGEDLTNNEIDWLTDHKYYGFTISYLIKHHEQQGNPWDLIKAGKLYRITDRPREALQLTENLLPFDNRAKSALCTNRGAAYKDLGEYKKARILGNKALEYQPNSYYAYNLLGAIFYKTGDLEEGDEHFERAVELGSSPKTKEHEIRKLLESETKENIQKTVDYLLEKDPQKYAWAKYYL